MHIQFSIRDGAVSRHDVAVQWWQARRLLNAVNGSTLLGLGVAALGRARLSPGPDGLVLATGSRLTPPGAGAFTLGNVVATHHDLGWLRERPRLLAHEARHCTQYAVLVGLPFLPLYGVAAAWSWLRGGDPATHNAFERWADLEDGGYPTLSARARRRSLVVAVLFGRRPGE